MLPEVALVPVVLVLLEAVLAQRALVAQPVAPALKAAVVPAAALVSSARGELAQRPLL